MYLSILRPTRRTLLKTVLNNFLNTPPQQTTPEAAKLFADLAAEARSTLREIEACERLGADPTIHISDETFSR